MDVTVGWVERSEAHAEGRLHDSPGPYRPPAWASLPCAARVALGEAFGRRVVLTAIDEAERFLIVDVDRGVESEVRGVTPVRSGGFGPVFLADTWWGVVDTAPGGAAAGRAAP